MGITDLKIAGKDKVNRAFILPQKVLWVDDGVTNQDLLLNPKVSQVYVGIPEVTTMSNEGGKKGAILLDFGSEFVGSVEFLVSDVSDVEGVRVRVRFGESVSEAMTPLFKKNATNDHAVRDTTIRLTALSQPTFGYTGYRFLYLELLEENTRVDFAAIRGVFTYRDIPYLGSFVSDNHLLNQIYDVCAYTVHINMQNMLWDGVKRDRLTWIGDMHPEMLAIRTVFGDNSIVDDSLKFIAETNPLPQWPNGVTTYSFWYLLILWDWYWYHGKLNTIVELKKYWIGLVKHVLHLVHCNETEILRETEFEHGFFIDWPTKWSKEAKAGVYALFRMALLAASKLCDLVNEKELAQRCTCYADILKVESISHNERKQIVALMQLADMIDSQTARDALIKGGGQEMSTFMSYYILTAVENTAGMESALEMLTEYYGAMLQAGATTFWEDFDLDWSKEGARIDKVLKPGEYDIHGDNGRFCYEGMRHSLCHGWSAGPAAFLAERVLGIQILEAGCKKISINPQLGPLQWVRGSYPTPYGVVYVEVRREGDKMIKKVNAPKQIELVESVE